MPFGYTECCSKHVFIGVAITRLDLFFSGLSPEKKKEFLSVNPASRAKRAVKIILAIVKWIITKKTQKSILIGHLRWTRHRFLHLWQKDYQTELKKKNY